MSNASLERWRAFIEPNAPSGFLFQVTYADAEFPEPDVVRPWPGKVAERIDWAMARYEARWAKASVVADDSLPCLCVSTGTEIFAEAFGCEVARPDDANPFALACVSTASEADALRVPELSTSSLAYLFDMGDELRARGGADALMKPVDVQSPMDIAALIWDKSTFFTALFDTPEAVLNLSTKVRTLLTAFMDEWFARYGTEYVAHYPDYLMSGGLTLSEDEIGAVNAEMFEAYFRDELVALSEHFGGLGIHCCADARHQWDNLAALPGLRALNLCRPPTGTAEEYVLPAYGFFGASVVQMHNGWEPDVPEAKEFLERHTDRRIVLMLSAKDRDDAVRIADELNEYRDTLG